MRIFDNEPPPVPLELQRKLAEELGLKCAGCLNFDGIRNADLGDGAVRICCKQSDEPIAAYEIRKCNIEPMPQAA